MLVDFRRFSSIARSLKRKSSIAASHFSTFFEFSHGLQEKCARKRLQYKAKTHFLTLTGVPYNKVMRQGGV